METNLTVAVGCDHGGYEIKEAVVAHLKELGYTVIDHGTDSKASVHYPIYAHKVCQSIQSGEASLGVLLCSSGIGMSMAANKHHGIRAALCTDTFSARFTRRHNDANVLCMGGNVVGIGLGLDILDAFLTNSFEGGRHQTRVDMFMELEATEGKH